MLLFFCDYVVKNNYKVFVVLFCFEKFLDFKSPASRVVFFSRLPDPKLKHDLIFFSCQI